MATYITLLTSTEKGTQEIKRTTARADAFRKMAERKGIRILNTFWLNGPFDGVHIFEVDNEEDALAHSFSFSSFGNVRTQTYQALSKDEVEPILDGIPDPFDLLKGD